MEEKEPMYHVEVDPANLLSQVCNERYDLQRRVKELEDRKEQRQITAEEARNRD